MKRRHSAYCTECSFLFVSGQKNAPKGCPKCRGSVRVIEVSSLDELGPSWEALMRLEGWPLDQAQRLTSQVQNARERFERRRPPKSGKAIAKHYRDKKNERIRREWKQAQIDLARSKKHLAGPEKKTSPGTLCCKASI